VNCYGLGRPPSGTTIQVAGGGIFHSISPGSARWLFDGLATTSFSGWCVNARTAITINGMNIIHPVQNGLSSLSLYRMAKSGSWYRGTDGPGLFITQKNK